MSVLYEHDKYNNNCFDDSGNNCSGSLNGRVTGTSNLKENGVYIEQEGNPA